MKRLRSKLGVIQNEGLVDRAVRFFIGSALLAFSIYSLSTNATMTWQGVGILASTYPLMTGIVGWDPIYSLFSAKTCSIEGKNQCGTLPYQMDAAMGHNPVPDAGHEYEHSLEGSHHEKGVKAA